MIATKIWPALAATLALAASGAAAAETVGTTPGLTSLVLDDRQPSVGQLIVAPGPNLSLQSVTLQIGYAVDGDPVISLLFVEVISNSGGVITVAGTHPRSPTAPAPRGAAGPVTFTFASPPVLDPAKEYLLVASRALHFGSGEVFLATEDAYPSGNAVTRQNLSSPYMLENTDLAFTAEFAPLPAEVPTLTEWSMIWLGLALAGGAVVTLQRRRPA